jgi:Zn-finger nucleic acid-binding protein
VQCPKDRKITLEDKTLSGNLAAKSCPECEGTWIPPEDYKMWQMRQSLPKTAADLVPTILDVAGFVQSPYDAKAALCPECGSYLARAKVGMKTPFYVERCLSCGGVWCDRGEWDALETMGLHRAIEQLFSAEWQSSSRDREHQAQERQATIERLGEDLANRVFELAEVLESHPHGDYGVAYLMRRFENFAQKVDTTEADVRNQEIRDQVNRN